MRPRTQLHLHLASYPLCQHLIGEVNSAVLPVPCFSGQRFRNSGCIRALVWSKQHNGAITDTVLTCTGKKEKGWSRTELPRPPPQGRACGGAGFHHVERALIGINRINLRLGQGSFVHSRKQQGRGSELLHVQRPLTRIHLMLRYLLSLIPQFYSKEKEKGPSVACLIHDM